MPEKQCKIQLNANGIATLFIPGSPTLSPRELLELLKRQLTIITGKEDVKGLIVTGSEAGFCRYRSSRSLTVREAAELSAFGQQLTFDLEKFGKPCIAAVDCECSGLGLEIALSCDFIVATRAARFGFPDIGTGLIPCCGGSQRLARLVGKSKAKELIFCGDLISAEEAFRIGLINRLFSGDDILGETDRLLGHICTRSPNAVRIGGEVINAGYDIDLQTACLLERDAFALCFASHDQREGMQAFLDKRSPHFKGE